MEEKDIKDNLKAAKEYLILLKNLQTEINYAEQQIHSTAEETENQITTIFSNVIASITSNLTFRRDELISKTKEIHKKGLLPLQQCQAIIAAKIKNTNAFISEGNDLLKTADRHQLLDFNNKSSLLGTLPEVPPLKEVPYISFQYETDDEEQLANVCRKFGSVIHIAPVQISTLSERPGAILVEWSISESDDQILDVEQYHLQWAFGNFKSLESDFHTCYIGPNVQYLVKELNLNQAYSFRVCCKFEGDTRWSPWSLPQNGQTTIRQFCWEENKNYKLTNENKIAIPLTITPSLLSSKRIEFNIGYSIEFTFLECGDSLSENYVGLFTESKLEGIVNSHSVCVEANGNIYGSGVKKTTQFSPVVKGSKICFTCDYKNENKLRINIDSDENRVTYDWIVDTFNIYIGAQFNSMQWKIMID